MMVCPVKKNDMDGCFAKGFGHRQATGASSDNHDAWFPGIGRVNRIAIIVCHIQEGFLFPLKILQTGISENRLAELPPDTGQVPTIFVVVIETAEMQDDTIEASEISSAARTRACGGRMHHFFLKLSSAAIAENLGRSRAFRFHRRICCRRLGGREKCRSTYASRRHPSRFSGRRRAKSNSAKPLFRLNVVSSPSLRCISAAAAD
jgi:hypothetical protein